LGPSRAAALAERCRQFRASLLAHWELGDTLGGHCASLGEALVAARIARLPEPLVQEAAEALEGGNWARHRAPPGAGRLPSAPTLADGALKAEVLEWRLAAEAAEQEPTLVEDVGGDAGDHGISSLKSVAVPVAGQGSRVPSAASLLMAELAPGAWDAVPLSVHSSFDHVDSFGNSQGGYDGEHHVAVDQAPSFEAAVTAFVDGLDAGWRLAELAAHGAECAGADMDAQFDSLAQLEDAWARLAASGQTLEAQLASRRQSLTATLASELGLPSGAVEAVGGAGSTLQETPVDVEMAGVSSASSTACTATSRGAAQRAAVATYLYEHPAALLRGGGAEDATPAAEDTVEYLQDG